MNTSFVIDGPDLYQLRRDGGRTRLGPAATAGSRCTVCGLVAWLVCQSCKAAYCIGHWHQHSHIDTRLMQREAATRSGGKGEG